MGHLRGLGLGSQGRGEKRGGFRGVGEKRAVFGVQIVGEAQNKDGRLWKVDVRVVSDGKYVYLFAVRHTAEYFEASHHVFEQAISTLKLTATD